MKKISMTEQDIEELMGRIRKDMQAKGLPAEIRQTVNPSVNLKPEEKVTLYFDNKAYKKMLSLVDTAKDEIGWYGTVSRKEKDFVVHDILVFPQIVTGATVNTDDLPFQEWQDSLTDEQFNSCRFYGHSHVNMNVSPSSVDNHHYSDMLQNVGDFYIFGIFNKRSEHWLNIYDVQNNVLYENNDINYMYYLSEEDTWADEQIKKYLKKPEPKKPVTGVATTSYQSSFNTYTGKEKKKEERKKNRQLEYEDLPRKSSWQQYYADMYDCYPQWDY